MISINYLLIIINFCNNCINFLSINFFYLELILEIEYIFSCLNDGFYVCKYL